MPGRVAILRQRDYLLATIQGDLSDEEVLALRESLTDEVGRHRAKAIIVDVTGYDVIDSFVARQLRDLAVSAGLRGAQTIVVGIQPDVAIAMVQFRLDLHPLKTALDLDEALVTLGAAAGAQRA
jgi:rsbT antagonist protein RsbS